MAEKKASGKASSLGADRLAEMANLNTFLELVLEDPREAAEFFIEQDLMIPARTEATDIDWYAVEDVEEWVEQYAPKLRQFLAENNIKVDD